MALKDTIPFGVALPHRSPDLINVEAVGKSRSAPRLSGSATSG